MIVETFLFLQHVTKSFGNVTEHLSIGFHGFQTYHVSVKYGNN